VWKILKGPQPSAGTRKSAALGPKNIIVKIKDVFSIPASFGESVVDPVMKDGVKAVMRKRSLLEYKIGDIYLCNKDNIETTVQYSTS